ncbi:MAG: DDE-type integrase/transposase/recombinase [Nanoarchaeota archaeon]
MDSNQNNPINANKDINKNVTISNKATQQVDRRKRAYALINSGKTPVVISEEEFLVPSQYDENKKYKVNFKDLWSCECPDFKNRCKDNDLYCKHIQSIQVWLKLRNSFDVENIDTREEACPNCDSFNIKKDGIRKNKNGSKQRYCCKNCDKRFVLEQLKYIKANGKDITMSMDLYFKGFSLSDISDHFKQFHNKDIHFDTIRRWIRKYTKIMNDYTKEHKADTGSRWHNDEQMVKVGSEWKWNNNLLDSETRFLLSTHLSKTRTIKDTRTLYQKGKQQSNNLPDEVYTDGLFIYDRAVKKEFNCKKRYGKPARDSITHIRNVGIAKLENNNKIERFHGTFREWDKVKRGFGNDETLEDWDEAFRLYYNFIKKHMALDGLTPSQIANIELALGRNRWLGLLKQSLDYNEKLAKHPNTTENNKNSETP